MDFNWPVVSVDDIKAPTKSSISIGPFGSRMKSDCYVDDGIPVIRGNNLSHSKSFVGDFVYISPEKADELASSNVFAGDLVFPHRGNIGEVGIVPADKPRYILSTSLMKLTVDQKKVDPLFLFYFFRSTKGRYELLKNASQVGTPGIATPLTSLKSIQLKLPSLSEQRAIAHIIGTLDDKIELNHQINQTLEAIAQAIFKSWFVDFEPVKAKIAAIEAGEDAEGVTRAAMRAISGKTCEELDQLQAEQPDNYTQLKTTAELFPAAMQDSELGDIPEGWEVIPFSKLAKLDTTSVKPHEEPSRLWEHYSIPAFDVYEAPVLELGSEIKSNKYKVNPTSILSSKLNPNTPRTWWPDVEYETSAICSTEFMQFIPTDESQRAFVFGLITSDPFQSGIKQRVTGSTGSRQRAQPSAVAEMDVVKPKEELVLAYCLHLTALFVLKAKNIKENITLAKLRDTLLPKLLSGELSVDAAKLAEE